ncbi:hypothetical protein PSDVSF_14250 [Pseudodesulfovibrio sediminis]|uniref:Uncharacterized protein n=1 Tax=Pseudodesulfovibrio sediminis TaxID=2810563 RepID=A0ABM7P5V3_9BACT|nr:hypothetical protein PSDVSF_14250 [Pseudodesulfovibrio sediminis]
MVARSQEGDAEMQIPIDLIYAISALITAVSGLLGSVSLILKEYRLLRRETKPKQSE